MHSLKLDVLGVEVGIIKTGELHDFKKHSFKVE